MPQLEKRKKTQEKKLAQAAAAHAEKEKEKKDAMLVERICGISALRPVMPYFGCKPCPYPRADGVEYPICWSPVRARDGHGDVDHRFMMYASNMVRIYKRTHLLLRMCREGSSR